MKHTKKKKLLAFVLCMVLVLSTAITAFAVDGNFYYVPKDTVELSHEIMKDGASQGTLYATVPGGAFKSSTDNAELQMDMQEETSESTVLEAVQTELENTGNTGYTVHQAVMGDVSFQVSTEDKAQIPEKAGLKIHPWIQRMQWDLSMTVQMAHLHCMILKKIHFNSKRMCNWKPRQL